LRNPDTIIIDYYQGAYGPTVRIDIHSMDDLIRIRNVINNIKNGKTQEFKFQSMDNAKFTNLSDLIMKLETKKRFYYHSIKVENTVTGSIILWLQTAKGWEHSEGQIDGLIENGGPGHQYLTRESDEVIVELAFNE